MAPFSGLSSCLICSRLLDEQKPITSYNNAGIIREKLSQLQRSLQCFCKLVNVNESDLVDKIIDQELNAYYDDEAETIDSSSQSEKYKKAFAGLPCCGECCEALDEILRLQQAIDDLKASQMNHVDVLKTSLLSLNDGRLDEDTWLQIRKQLIDCILQCPLPSQSSSNPSYKSSRAVPNIPDRKPAEDFILPDSKISDGTCPTRNAVSVETTLETTFDIDSLILSPFSPPSPEASSFNGRLQRKKRKCVTAKPSSKSSRQQKKAKTSDSEKHVIDMGLVRPCSVFVERLSSPMFHKREKEESETEVEEGAPKARKGTIQIKKTGKETKAENDNYTHPVFCTRRTRNNKKRIEKTIDSDDDFVPHEASSHDDDDSDDEYIPFECPASTTTPKKIKNSKEIVPHSQAEAVQCRTNAGKGSRLNDKIWMVNEDTLLFKVTLIQVSHCATHLTCLEDNCTTIIRGLDYSTLFENMKEHVNSSHLPANEKRNFLLKGLSSKPCPISSCEAQFIDRMKLRIHLFTVHSMEKVICEICLKPMRDLGDSYKRHKWSHRNYQEKLEVPPPKQVIYKALQSRKGSKSRIKLEGLGVKLDEKLETVQRKVKTLKTKSEGTKTKVKTPTKRAKRSFGPNSKYASADVFLKLEENLLLYKYTLIRVLPGQGLCCGEPGCSTENNMVVQGTDYEAFELIKEHVESCHEKTSGDGGDDSLYVNLPRECPLCPVGDNVFNGFYFCNHFISETPGGHHGTTRFFCHCCWKPLKSKSTLMYHMWSHKSEEEKSVFDENSSIKKLVKSKIKIGTFTCSTCGRELKNKFLLQAHEATHLPKELRPQFDCPHCSDKFLSAVAVRNHIERKHRPDLIRYRHCPICEQKFNYREGYKLAMHIKSHKNPNDRPFVCDFCGTAFATSSYLKHHLNSVHLKIRTFQCEFCTMSYRHGSNLKRHRYTAHKDKLDVMETTLSSEEKSKATVYEYRPDFIGPKIAYPCQFCDKVFQLKSRMTKHVKMCKHANEISLGDNLQSGVKREVD